MGEKKGFLYHLGNFFRTGIDSISLFKSNHLLLFLVVLFDLLFILSYMGLNFVWNLVFPSSQAFEDMLSMNVVLWLSSLLVVVYFLCIALLYSLFKYIVLHQVKSYYKKEKFSMGNFLRFFCFNLTVIVIIVAYYLLLSYFAFSFVKQELIGIFGIVTLVPVAYFLYPYMNAVQMMMVSDRKLGLKRSFINGFIFLKDNIAEYSKLYLIDLIFFAVYFLLIALLTTLLNILLFKDDATSASFMIFQGIFFGITIAMIWFAIIYNRVYLCSLIRQKK